MHSQFFKIIIFVLFPLLFVAQSRSLDSLKQVIKSGKHDTIRFSAMAAFIEKENNSAIWLPINKQLLMLADSARRTSKKPVLVKAYSKYAAIALANLAYYQEDAGEIAQAILNYNKALKILENTGLQEEILSMENNLGAIYMDQGDISRATQIFEQTLKGFESIHDKRGIGRALNNLAFIYQGQGNNIIALEYFERAVKYKTEDGDDFGTAVTYNNIGFIYQSINNLDLALQFYNKAFEIRQKQNDSLGIAGSLLNIGSVYFEQGKYLESNDFYTKAIKIAEKINDKSLMSTILSSLASVGISQGKYDEAHRFASKSYAISKELGYPEPIQYSSEMLKKIYQKQGKYKEALEMFELYVRMRDSVNNESNRKASIKSQLKYEYEKQAAADSVAHAKESEIKNVQLQKQNAEIKAKKNQQYALFGGLGLVIIFAGFMYNRFKITQKQKFVIEEQKLIVEEQKKIVEEKQKEVLDSIHYAKRIQMALLPNEKLFQKNMQKLKKN